MVTMKIYVLWNVTHCLITNYYRRFEEAWCFRSVSESQLARLNVHEDLNSKETKCPNIEMYN